MTSTFEPQYNRRTNVGASEVPAILGMSEFQNPWNVWDSKVNGYEPRDSPSMRIGTALEDGILKLALHKIQVAEEKLDGYTQITKNHRAIPLAATCDFLYWGEYTWRNKLHTRTINIEAKTTGFSGAPSEEWGRGGSEQVPRRVWWQVQAQMLAGDLLPIDMSYVALLSGHDGKGFRMYQVKPNKHAAKVITAACTKFMQYVKAEQPPDPDRSILDQ